MASQRKINVLILIAVIGKCMIGEVQASPENSFEFETVGAETFSIPITLTKNDPIFEKSFYFNFPLPQDVIVQIMRQGEETHSRHIPGPNFILSVYEFLSEGEAVKSLSNIQEGSPDEKRNLVTLLSNSHSIDHIRFQSQYFYIFRLAYSTNQSQNPNDLNYVGDEQSQEFTQNYVVSLKFLKVQDLCGGNGDFDEAMNKCSCGNGEIGSFCQYELSTLANYNQVDISVKPFEGKYVRVLNTKFQPTVNLEIIMKHNTDFNIYAFFANSTSFLPSQHNYTNFVCFNSTRRFLTLDLIEGFTEIFIFLRNPSISYLYFTISVVNEKVIDPQNPSSEIAWTMFALLFLLICCFFGFLKFRKWQLKRKGQMHSELQESQAESQKQKQFEKDNDKNNGAMQPSTNRNLIGDIMTQREIQIKSEMDQITKGDKYEQFQMEVSFKEQICAICLDDFQYDDLVRKTRCNHMFHEKCLFKWLFKYISCPMCNQDIT